MQLSYRSFNRRIQRLFNELIVTIVDYSGFWTVVFISSVARILINLNPSGGDDRVKGYEDIANLTL